MKKLFYSIVNLLVLLSSIYVLSAQQTGRFTMQMDNEGITSYIYFYVPENYNASNVYPFLWGWHGAGMPGSDMRDFLYSAIAQKIGAIVVCPDANNAQTQNQLNNLINSSYNYAISNYHIGTTKRIITGFSWGGRVAFELGLSNPNLLDGIIALAPAIGQLTQAMWDNIKTLPMATILGDKDFNFTVVNDLMNQIKSSGGNLLYLLKPGLDHTGTNGYFGTQEFLDDYMQCYLHVTGGATEISENETAHYSAMISPNPANEFIKIDILNNNNDNVNITILNEFGIKILEEVNKNANHITINTKKFQCGIYFCIIRSGNRSELKKFMIVR